MNRINEIQNTISGFYAYDDDMVHDYTSLIEEVIELIRDIEAKPTSILDNVKNETVTELSNELANRMSEKSFFNSSSERRKSDFKISKALVVVAIGNVISAMSPE